MNLASPLFPFLVVIITTPFAALDPYKDAAAASFNTVVDSISSGLIELNTFEDAALCPKFPVVIATPSTIYKGEVLPVIEPIPLIWISPEDPGAPVLEETRTPDTFPAKALSIDSTLTLLSSSELTVLAAPVNEAFLAVP